jgi:hypothetical protein
MYSCAALCRYGEDDSYYRRCVDDADDRRASSVLFRKKCRNEGKDVEPNCSLNVVHICPCMYLCAMSDLYLHVCMPVVECNHVVVIKLANHVAYDDSDMVWYYNNDKILKTMLTPCPIL